MRCHDPQSARGHNRGRALGLLTFALAACAACGDDTGSFRDLTFPTAIPPVAAGTWPQYRLDPSHQGLSPPGTSLGTDLTLAWQTVPFGIGNYSASKSSPAVDVDRIFVGVDDGELLALDRTDGMVIWRFQTHRYQVELATTDSQHLGIHGSPAFDDQHVYIGDYSGYLYAVDKRSGTLVWENQLGGSIGASPVVLGGFVFVAVEYPDPDGRVFVLRAATGEVMWATPSLGHFPHASVSLAPSRGLMFVGANNGNLYCFDYVRRQLVWTYPTGGAIKSTAAVAGDTVYVTSWDSKLHAVEIATGEARLTHATGAASMSSPSVFASTVYFGSDDKLLYAVDTRDGHLVWAFQSQDAILSSPTVLQEQGLVAIGSRDRRLYLLDLASGELRESLSLVSTISSVPVAVGDTLFVNDDAGAVYAFRGSGN
jgi:outer membrane protein assembly factor BamB